MEKKLVTEQQQLNDFLSRLAKEADERVSYFIYGFFILGIFIAPIYNTWVFALGVGGLSLGAYFICKQLIAGTFLSRMVISLIFSMFMLQFIGQMHGIYEMHFFFFINIAILIIYRDWRIMVPYALFAIVHHTFFFILQLRGYDTGKYFINSDDVTWLTLILHFSLVALMAVVCGWWSIVLHKELVTDFHNQFLNDQQLVKMKYNIEFAEEISQGKLQENHDIEDHEELGQALLKMRDSLYHARLQEEQERFQSVGLSEFGDIIRKNNASVETLSNAVIVKLVKYLNINQGGIFILEQEDDHEFLDLQGCYAYDRRKYLQKRIEIGEGLVGQAFIEKQSIYLTEVPDHYIHISSGLGDAKPRSILVVPLKYEEQVVGVVELASFKTFPNFHINFIEKAGEVFAATLIATKNNQRTQSLLESFQQQSEQLRAQEEEMRQNMEELSATQEEILRAKTATEKLLLEQQEQVTNLRIKEEELQKLNEEMEEVRRTEKERANAQINSQKDMMVKLMEKQKKVEAELRDRIKELENKFS